MTDIKSMISDMEGLVCDLRDGTERVYIGVCNQENEKSFPFLAGAVHRRAVELFEAWKALHKAAFTLEDKQPDGLDKEIVAGLVRDLRRGVEFQIEPALYALEDCSDANRDKPPLKAVEE